MSDTHIELSGFVTESCRGVLTVELNSGQVVKTRLSGKMRLNKINVIVGDKVVVKMSTFDTTKGIIFKLLREKRNGQENRY